MCRRYPHTQVRVFALQDIFMALSLSKLEYLEHLEIVMPWRKRLRWLDKEDELETSLRNDQDLLKKTLWSIAPSLAQKTDIVAHTAIGWDNREAFQLVKGRGLRQFQRWPFSCLQ